MNAKYWRTLKRYATLALVVEVAGVVTLMVATATTGRLMLASDIPLTMTGIAGCAFARWKFRQLELKEVAGELRKV